MDEQIIAVYGLSDHVVQALHHPEAPQRPMTEAERMTTAVGTACVCGGPHARALFWAQYEACSTPGAGSGARRDDALLTRRGGWACAPGKAPSGKPFLLQKIRERNGMDWTKHERYGMPIAWHPNQATLGRRYLS